MSLNKNNRIYLCLRSEGFRSLFYRIIYEFYWKFICITKPKFAISAYGPKFKLNLLDITFKFYIKGSYGYYFSNLLSNINYDFIFLDIGANQGLYTFISAQNNNCKYIYSFEPVSTTYDYLLFNLELNPATKKIITVNSAVSNVDGERIISINPGHSGVASLDHSSGSTVENISCISYKLLQNYIHDNGLKIVIKIDTEGHEPIVINELLKSNFLSRISVIFFEVDEKWFDVAMLVSQLNKVGFKEVHRTSYQSSHYDITMER